MNPPPVSDAPFCSVRPQNINKDRSTRLRAAVLGANDGLVSNLCLVMGVAGANAEHSTILLTGFAGLLSGACSMALGEWISVSNAREMNAKQVLQERKRLVDCPGSETQELEQMLQNNGLPAEQAKQMSIWMMAHTDAALAALARERWGIDPKELGGNPWIAAITSFLLFSCGALVPILPFTWLDGLASISVGVIFSLLALMLTGVLTARVTGRGPLFSALRQVTVGTVAASFTYGLGILLGISLS
ncbi:MAG TPA: VIT1/CCC1 transporter family protein [Pseudomonas sp.]|uniref:VIT1/CCC1 transporter family protein n=1 Tax=Pseudomonas sp. TaxID=306 RepID=UPI002EDB62B4